MSFRRFVTDRWQLLAGLPFGLGALLAFVIGTVALGGSVAVFGAATEDVTRHNGLALHDAARLRFFSDHRSAVFVHAAKVATDIGAVPVVAAIAVLAGLLLWWRGQRLAIALSPLVSFAVAATAVAATKGIVGRQRPPLTLHLVSESDASFPSGHATNSTAVFVTVALVVAVFILRRPIARALAVLVAGGAAAAVGASRLVLGVHWPSDVLAGLALGFAVALAVTMSAAMIGHLAPRSPTSDEGMVRRLGSRLHRSLVVERRPHQELRAA